MIAWIADAEMGLRSLLLTTAVGVISGAASGWIAFLMRRKELVATTVQAIEERRGTLRLETDEARSERIRTEVLRWANPLLGAVRDLSSRLQNILGANGWRALHANYQSSFDPNWSISHEYFLSSTLYLFGQYFACIRLLQEELSFEMFRSERVKNEFFESITRVVSHLGRYPTKELETSPDISGADAQVFRLQQQAIGELMLVRDQPNHWLTYPEFLRKFNSEPEFKQHFAPLIALLLNLDREDPGDRRHRRLRSVAASIDNLEQLCKRVLSLDT